MIWVMFVICDLQVWGFAFFARLKSGREACCCLWHRPSCCSRWLPEQVQWSKWQVLPNLWESIASQLNIFRVNLHILAIAILFQTKQKQFFVLTLLTNSKALCIFTWPKSTKCVYRQNWNKWKYLKPFWHSPHFTLRDNNSNIFLGFECWDIIRAQQMTIKSILIIQKEMHGYAMEFAYIWGEGEKWRKSFRVRKIIWSIKPWL